MRAAIIKRFKVSICLLGLVLITGTLGYWLITGERYSLFDCLYMTFMTIFTIGFEETVKPEAGTFPWVRVFTIFIALTGIGTATYIFSNITALIVEGHIKETYKNRKIKKIIKKMENHYIVCGAGRVGSVIINELFTNKREIVAVEQSKEVCIETEEKYPGIPVINGNADLEEILIEAGIKSAAGIFAATGDDNQNLVISLTSKHINHDIRVVARCLEAANLQKIKKAGADAVITTNFIAGMRMASEMVRPTVVSFLDKMLLEKEKNLRVEEIIVHNRLAGRKITELGLENFPDTLLLAVISGAKEWTYNPKEDYIVKDGSKIVVITNPDERQRLKTHLHGE